MHSSDASLFPRRAQVRDRQRAKALHATRNNIILDYNDRFDFLTKYPENDPPCAQVRDRQRAEALHTMRNRVVGRRGAPVTAGPAAIPEQTLQAIYLAAGIQVQLPKYLLYCTQLAVYAIDGIAG